MWIGKADDIIVMSEMSVCKKYVWRDGVPLSSVIYRILSE